MRKGEKKDCEQEREREREGVGEGEGEGEEDKRRVLANLFIKTRTQIVKSFLLSFSLHFFQIKNYFCVSWERESKVTFNCKGTLQKIIYCFIDAVEVQRRILTRLV